jgi:hypothetical protein
MTMEVISKISSRSKYACDVIVFLRLLSSSYTDDDHKDFLEIEHYCRS